jgi:hypothetical protein
MEMLIANVSDVNVSYDFKRLILFKPDTLMEKSSPIRVALMIFQYPEMF